MRKYKCSQFCVISGPLITGSEVKNIFYLMDNDKLLTLYLQGKSLVQSASETLIEKHGQASVFSANLDYWTGLRLIAEVKDVMIRQLCCLIHFIIRHKFTNYLAYQNDLFQEGVIGLLKGIDRYHPSKGKPINYICESIITEIGSFIHTNVMN